MLDSIVNYYLHDELLNALKIANTSKNNPLNYISGVESHVFRGWRLEAQPLSRSIQLLHLDQAGIPMYRRAAPWVELGEQ